MIKLLGNLLKHDEVSNSLLLQPSGGMIGIGTTNPSYTVHLVADQDALTSLAVVNSTNSAGAGARLFTSSGTSSSQIFQFAFPSSATLITEFSGDAGFYTGTSTKDLAIASRSATGEIKFYTGGSDATNRRMTIDETGNVGIGSTTTSEKLYVAGYIKNSYPSINILTVNTTSFSGADVAARFDLTTDVSNVGLSFRLAKGNQRYTSNATTVAFMQYGSAVDQFEIVQGFTTRLAIDSTGKVGIGNGAPAGKLDVPQSSTTAAIPVLKLDQADVSEEFIEFVSTSAANNTNPISTTAVGTYAGKLRINVNGTYYWLAYYNS